MISRYRAGMAFALLAAALLLPRATFAGAFTLVSDLISTSQPSASADHTLTFTTSDAIPAGGRIIITLDPGSFSIPIAFSVSDVDLSVSEGGGPYAERALAASQDATYDGVTIVTGTSGSVTITLASSTGIAAASAIRVKLGAHASSQASGSRRISNPATVGSFPVYIEAQAVDGSSIASANALDIIVLPVSTGATANETNPPYRFDGLPSGDVAFDITTVELSLRTNDVANCRYSTVATTTYASMTGTFTVTDANFHTKIISGIVPETTYAFYVRCQNTLGNTNDDDYLISFETGSLPGDGSGTGGGGTGTGGGTGSGSGAGTGSGSGGGGGGGGGSGGGGGIAGGTPFPSLSATIQFNGIAYPGSTVSILRDGTKETDVPALPSGRFSAQLSGLPRGTYTFTLYATDKDARASSKYTTTFSLVGGTGNTVGNVIIPPTIRTPSETVPPGARVTVQGYAAQNSTVEAWFYRQARVVREADAMKAIVAADSSGLWSASFDTAGLPADTYVAKARMTVTATEKSDFGSPTFIGVGVSPKPETSNTADLNRDGKINLIDFSILLFHWGTDGGSSDPPADINQDKKVNLADFSIMLFNWTG